jgi:hypothetical protein
MTETNIKSWITAIVFVATGCLALMHPACSKGTDGVTGATRVGTLIHVNGTHEAIYLRDVESHPIDLTRDTTPYSPRQTCGYCHDYHAIEGGYHFQQGAGDLADDFGSLHGTHDFVLSPGMVGQWLPFYCRQLAKEENTYDHELDLGLFEFATSRCAVCHPGGGAMEYDRNGNRYDLYLASGGGPLLRNGDYYYFDQDSGSITPAPWDTAGVLEIDCLICHMPGYSMEARATQILSNRLRAAPTAGAGFGTVVDHETVSYDPDLPARGIDLYSSGNDHAGCNRCHGMDENGFYTSEASLKIPKADIIRRGMAWGTGGALTGAPLDFNDIHEKEGLSCMDCHQADMEHNITKGNAPSSTVRDDLDFTVTSCEACHVDPVDDQDSEGVDPASAHLDAGLGGVNGFHMYRITCEACHIPYKSTATYRTVDLSSGQLFNEAGTERIEGRYGLFTGGTEDPATWTSGGLRFTCQWRNEEDGSFRLKPMNMVTSLLWNEGEEISHPYFMRYVLDAGAALLAAGKIGNDVVDPYHEINKAQEIDDMRRELINVGYAVGDPAMVDPRLIVSSQYFSISHNVRESGDALGASGCTDCHDSAAHGGQDRWFFDGEYLLWSFPFEDSPHLADHVTYTKRDGSTGRIGIDFSKPDHNMVRNWQLMDYSPFEHDLLVTPKTR